MLHALDPIAAAEKYGSTLKQKQLDMIDKFLRERGTKLEINAGNQEKIRANIED